MCLGFLPSKTMEDKVKQMQDFAQMLEVIQIPIAERPLVMMGVRMFFDRGWPKDHFTVGMAARAGSGHVPPIYDGIGSEERYFQTTKPSTQTAELAQAKAGGQGSQIDPQHLDGELGPTEREFINET
jgi:hypothetical protein